MHCGVNLRTIIIADYNTRWYFGRLLGTFWDAVYIIVPQEDNIEGYDQLEQQQLKGSYC